MQIKATMPIHLTNKLTHMFLKFSKYALLLFLLQACNNSAEQSETTERILTTENSDQAITSITLSPHLTELVYSSGGGAHLLGISAYSNYPEDALNKQIIGDAFHLNLELISELQPDVIFYWHNGTPAQTIEQLKSLGFKLENVDITDLADIPKAINQIATTLKTQPDATTESFLTQLNQLKQQSQHRKPALIQISDQPIFTVNGKHWMSEAIAVCGLDNVFNDLKSLSVAVTLESVVLKQPDVIVRLEPLSADSQLAQWPSIPAIKNNHVAVLEADHFTRPTLRLLTAIKSLCEQATNF